MLPRARLHENAAPAQPSGAITSASSGSFLVAASTIERARSDAAVGVDRGERNRDADRLQLERRVADQILDFPLRAPAAPDLDVALFAGDERNFPNRRDATIIIEFAAAVMLGCGRRETSITTLGCGIVVMSVSSGVQLTTRSAS